jgi:hypothetical protein
MKQVAVLTLWVSLLCLIASAVWSVPYVVTFAWISVLACGGHLITLDDDLAGGWSNPDGEKSIVRWSLIELGLKVLFAILVWWLIYQFPGLKEYGA